MPSRRIELQDFDESRNEQYGARRVLWQMNRIVGIGNDIIHIPRVKAVFEKYGDRFLKRMCHPEEITAFKARQTQQHGDSAFTLLATLYVCL